MDTSLRKSLAWAGAGGVMLGAMLLSASVSVAGLAAIPYVVRWLMPVVRVLLQLALALVAIGAGVYVWHRVTGTRMD